MADLPKRPKRVELEQVCKENMPSWFTVGPSKQYGLALTVQGDVRDCLNMRHGQELRGLPSVCVGCGTFQFGARPELYDERGEYETTIGKDQKMRRDECVHLCTMAYRSAGDKKDLFLRDASGNVRGDTDLRVDFMVHSVWERQRVAAFFDRRIFFNADAPSRFDRNPSYVTAMRAAVQEEKKKKYLLERCEEMMAGSFTPLVCTVDGFFHREFVAFMKRVAAALAGEWGSPMMRR